MRASGEGYAFLADRVIELDKTESTNCCSIGHSATRWKKYDTDRQILMKHQLDKILDNATLSKDSSEIVSKGKITE